MVASIKDVVENNLCVSCGACCFSDGTKIADMVESKEKGIYVPKFIHTETSTLDICPGNGYAIESMGTELFPEVEFNDLELGRWKQAVV